MEKITYEELLERNENLERLLRYYQEYDFLTGIYNQNTFYQRVSELLEAHPDDSYYIVCVDIERFKVVNDLCGTEKGDFLLKYLAQGLCEEFFSLSCTVSRLSADLFAACMSCQITPAEIEQTILRIFNNAPLDINIIPAIGIYQTHDRSLSVEQMCDRAILALNSIKGNYLKHCTEYHESLWTILLQEQEIITRADFALRNNEFEVYMQPKCNMRTGKIVGAEALVRWRHPEKGLIAPSVFIPVFEKNGFIKNLDTFVWEEVVKSMHQRLQQGKLIIPISVNVSRIDILEMKLLPLLQNLLAQYQINPSNLELEITESAYTSQLDSIITTVDALMQAGYTVLMDDFGSGYSSLNILKDISITILKLDLRFLDSTNNKSKDIIESVVHMAKWLNLHIIVEGVETKSQVDFLLSIGCEYAQGYYYYKPMPMHEFYDLLEQDENIEFFEQQKQNEYKENLIKFKDLFHADMMSEQLLNNILGGIALYQYDGTSLQIIRYNSQYYQITQTTEDSLNPDKNVFDRIYAEDHACLYKTLLDAKSLGNQGISIQLRRITTTASPLWLQLHLFHLADSNGKQIFYAGVSDVTEQMNQIEELRLSEQLFRIAMDASHNTLFEVDIETRIARFAKHTQDEFGLDDCVADAPEGFIRQGSVCDDYIDDFCEMYYSIYRGEDFASCVVQAHMGDDSIIWNRISLTALKDKTGKTIKAVGLVQNITHEKELEAQLVHSKDTKH